MSQFASISTVSFRLGGGDAAKRASVVEVSSLELTRPSLTPGGDPGPAPGGLLDLRLGTTDHGVQCLTCAQGKKACPGP